jgi:hypothetical protein
MVVSFMVCLAAVASSSSLHPHVAPFVQLATGGYGLKVSEWTTSTPIEIEVIGVDGVATWIRSSYDSLHTINAGAGGTADAGARADVLQEPALASGHGATTSATIAKGAVILGNGTVMLFVTDAFSIATSTEIVLNRTIIVSTNSTGYSRTTTLPIGFSSRFALGLDTPNGFGGGSREFFVPGVWYLHSQGATPPGALAGDLNASHVLVREDRLPLPFVGTYQTRDAGDMYRGWARF